MTSVAEWLSRKFGRKLDDAVPRPGSVSQEVFDAAPRPHARTKMLTGETGNLYYPSELSDPPKSMWDQYLDMPPRPSSPGRYGHAGGPIIGPAERYADSVRDLRKTGRTPVGGGPGFHMPDPSIEVNYAPPPTLGDAPRLPPVNMVDPPLSPANRARVARPETPPETHWYNPRDLLRNIGGAPADSPGLGGLGAMRRGIFKPRYPGLDRPLGENTSGFFNWSFNNPYNKANWYARPLDRTRQSAANALRATNAGLLVGGTAGAAYTAGQGLLYERPRQIADFVSKVGGLNEAENRELYESINGIEAFKILTAYGTDWGDPFWRGAQTDVLGDAWDATRREAYAQNQEPYRWPFDALKMVTPAGAGSLIGRHMIADPVPSVPREKSRDFASTLTRTLLEDPEAIRNSNLLAALRDIIPKHIHEKLMTRLRDFGVSEDQPNMANSLADLIDSTTKRLNDAGITNHEGLSDAIIDSAFVPSKDPKREADLAGELTYLNNEVEDLYQQVNDHLGVESGYEWPGWKEDQQASWPAVAARLYKENPKLYANIVANNKKKSDVITALRTLHPNYYGVGTPDNTARKGQSIFDSLFGGGREDNLDRALRAPAIQEAARLQNWHPGPDRLLTPQLGYEEMMAIIQQARSDPRFGQSNVSPKTIMDVVKNYFTKNYNTDVPPTIRFK